MNYEMKRNIAQIITVAIILVVTIVAYLAIEPQYRVYKATQEGIARLREAESSKQILVQQAQAEKDAAQLRADAIKIMGEVAKEYPEYRSQEYIGAFADALREGKITQTIYVPTLNNIPILETAHQTKTSNI